MEESKKIIEINGIKMEVDLRTAKTTRVDLYKAGDRVKLLRKEYSEFKVYPGVIVGFDDFENRPAIVVAYVDAYGIKVEYIHEGCEHEVLHVNDGEQLFNAEMVLNKLNRKIETKEQELIDARAEKERFLSMAQVYVPEFAEETDNFPAPETK